MESRLHVRGRLAFGRSSTITIIAVLALVLGLVGSGSVLAADSTTQIRPEVTTPRGPSPLEAAGPATPPNRPQPSETSP